LLGLLDHVFDLLLAESSLVVGDGDLVLLSSCLVLSGNVKDTVGINIEGDLDLRNSSWCWWNTSKFELS